jgi:3-methyladenine DNA glycosylase AlkD
MTPVRSEKIPLTQRSPEKILASLESMANPAAVAGMARFGIKGKRVLGVSIPALRDLAKRLGRDQHLASLLWSHEVREMRVLASLIGEPGKIDEATMDAWVEDFDSWEICDQCCQNLLARTDMAWRKAIEWSERGEEFVKRAGFVLMARLAVTEKKARDDDFAPFWAAISKHADDARGGVKKAVSWALRQLGKRSFALNQRAIALAQQLGEQPEPTSRWIARDALRELNSAAVQQRLRAGKG